MVYLDWIEVSYPRVAIADGDVFRFGAATDGATIVSGLSGGTVALYDVSTEGGPVYYGEVPVTETGLLSFSADAPTRRFVAAAPEAILAPVEIVAHTPADLRAISEGADYVIIAASHLVADAEALADYREADGYRVLLVDVDDVFWEFADGEPDPAAIRAFLTHAWNAWETRPRFVTLVGKASVDYRDLLGMGGNWLPAMLAPTDGGLLPSDSMLGDVAGDDGVPELAVGRLPITTADELERILGAIQNFETLERNESGGPRVFASDANERGDFAAASALLAETVPVEWRVQVDLDEDDLASARERLLAAWREPIGWLSYVGHGGLDRLANEGLVASEDVAELSSMAGTPVVAAWSCNIARFDLPGFFSLGEELLISGASPGVYSATGWSNHMDTDAMRIAFSHAAFASDAETVGDAMLAAHGASATAPLETHRVYVLLGDPALRLRQQKSVPDSASDRGPEPSPTPDDPTGTPRLAADPEPPHSGCEIGARGRQRGPVAPALLLLGLMWAIGARRTRREARRHLH